MRLGHGSREESVMSSWPVCQPSQRAIKLETRLYMIPTPPAMAQPPTFDHRSQAWSSIPAVGSDRHRCDIIGLDHLTAKQLQGRVETLANVFGRSVWTGSF